jgi:hypothetical protein
MKEMTVGDLIAALQELLPLDAVLNFIDENGLPYTVTDLADLEFSVDEDGRNAYLNI